MNISLAIADSNRDYVEKLSEVLQQYSELIIHVYTSAEKLEAAMEKSGFDVVLFDPDLTERKIIFQKVKLPIELYSDEAINRGLYPDMEKIIKYQRISAIYKEIVRAYADKAGYSLDFDNSQKTKILAVHSPLGGCGKTVISLVIASKMVGLGKSVLYLNLEQLNSSICLNPKVEEGVTALVESLGDGHTNFEFRVRGSLKIGLNGISYIEGFDRIVDYEAVEEREITEVVTKLKRLGICDVIVIDMNNQIDGMSKALYEIADQVILVDRPGELPTR